MRRLIVRTAWCGLALWPAFRLPAETPPINQEQAWTAYIREQAAALDGEETATRLVSKLARRELVLLGETTHGTHEYYRWRAEISKALIAEKGFRFIAVEGDWSALDRLDRYVRRLDSGHDSARDVLATFDRWPEWMWANPVIEELAEWLRAYNADRPRADRAGIHGIDVYGWGDSVALLPESLEALDPGWGARAGFALAPLLRHGGDSRAFAQAVLHGRPTGAEKLDRIADRLERDAHTLRAADPEAWMQANQKTALIRQAKRHLRKSVQNHPRSWNPRAENFMETVARLRAYYGEGARGIVWAHNTHIGDARHTPMGPGGLITVGQRARETLGAETVFLLGFAGDRGTFRAGRQWGAPGEVMPLPTALGGTLDAFLRDALPETPVYFLPLARARDDAMLAQPAGHRAIGVVFTPGSPPQHGYVPSVIPWRYDGLLFVRETRALETLE